MAKYWLEIQKGAQKKLCPAKKKKTQFLFVCFFCWAQSFAPPSEWRPRRPPIPPVGKTAPGCIEVGFLGCLSVCNRGEKPLGTLFYAENPYSHFAVPGHCMDM